MLWHLPRLKLSRQVAAPSHRVWRVVTDTGGWADWGPGIVKVDSEDRYLGPKSQGRIRTWLGYWIQFRVVGFETLRSCALQLGGARAEVKIEMQERNATTLSVELSFQGIHYLPLAWVALRRLGRSLQGQQRP